MKAEAGKLSAIGTESKSTLRPNALGKDRIMDFLSCVAAQLHGFTMYVLSFPSIWPCFKLTSPSFGRGIVL
jgi:hypothetical protein